MPLPQPRYFFFFFNDTATTEIYPSFPTRRSSDLVVMLALRHLRAPAPVAQEDGAQAEPAPPRPLWVGLLVACAAVASIATIALAVTGYVALAGTLARQMV